MVEPSGDSKLKLGHSSSEPNNVSMQPSSDPTPGGVDAVSNDSEVAPGQNSATTPNEASNSGNTNWKVVVNDTRVESSRPEANASTAAMPAMQPPSTPGLPFPTNFNIPTEDDDPGGEWIDRTNTPLGKIGAGYELTPRLQTLCLTNNRIKKIENLEQCPNLRELILRQNAITVVEGLELLSELEDLDLYMNAVETVPPGTFKANPKLRRVDLSFNQLRVLDEFPSEHLNNIEELYLIGNKVRKITGLEGMPKITMLELGDNRIRDIENLGHLTSLHGLWLGRNKISDIRNLENLVELRRLSLQSNRITEIRGLETLVKLEELYLSHNGIQSMSGLEVLVNLCVLDLGSNEIEHIEGVDKLTRLKEFWFNGNKLESFEELLALQETTELETVYLEGNPVAKDPEYQRKVLDILPPSLEQLDALLVCDVRRKLQAQASNVEEIDATASS